MDVVQPSIHIFGLLIEEPVTTLTDLLVTAICLYAFFKLGKIANKQPVKTYLRIYFLSMGIATAIGGLIGHGFFYAFDYNMYWKLPGWLTSMVSIAMLERASIEYSRRLINKKTGVVFAWLNITELFTFMVITLVSQNFFFVEVHSAYGLLVVVSGFNFYIYYNTKSKGSKLFLIAVGFSAISALVFMNKWGISKWFNHFDISHVVMTISAWYFYRGAKYILKEQ